MSAVPTYSWGLTRLSPSLPSQLMFFVEMDTMKCCYCPQTGASADHGIGYFLMIRLSCGTSTLMLVRVDIGHLHQFANMGN